jgi:HPt (histidine-containing phosphotransfer) domain-containing protein
VELAALSAALQPQAGSAPSAGLDRLYARLADQFRHEAPGQGAALGLARDRLDWAALQAGAHYLKNSAAVVRDDRLFEACARVEKAALDKSAGALAAAWPAWDAALKPWLAKK